MAQIRLQPHEIAVIKEAFHKYFMEFDHLWIFGSRAYPQARGGDIDLYIETNYKDPKRIIDAKLDFLVDIKKQLGEQKIDLIIKMHDDFDLPIYHVAKSEGIQLL